ncbi:MAG: aminotransferase class IV, partial [Bdellovibrionales bacterium]
ASAANLFIVKDGVLKTPTTECILNGITRQTIIELAHEHNIPFEEKEIMPEELYEADEVFLTGTAAEITTVGEIDGHKYIVGEISKLLRSSYEELVRR